MEDITDAMRKRLRRMLGDRVPPGGDENDAFFDNAEIEDLLTVHPTMEIAAFYGWLDKMAEFAKLVDRNISGADMRLSKMFSQAEAMLRHYGEVGGITNADVLIGRCVGRAVNLRENTVPRVVMTGAIGAARPESTNMEMRRIMHNSHPEMLEDGHETYPEPGPVATS